MAALPVHSQQHAESPGCGWHCLQRTRHNRA
jgi:hypothetical protein